MKGNIFMIKKHLAIILILIFVLTVGCTHAIKISTTKTTKAENSNSASTLNTSDYVPLKIIAVISIDQALESGAVKADLSNLKSTDNNYTSTYNIDRLENFISNIKKGKPDSVTAYTFRDLTATDLYYLTFDGSKAYCYKYQKQENGEYSYSIPIPFKNITKIVKDNIQTYKIICFDSNSNIEIFSAQNVIEPKKAIQCAEFYVKALKERNGITQYYISAKELRSQFLIDFNGWITGVSSPHINSYSVLNGSEINGKYIFNVKIVWEAGGISWTDDNTLTIIKENGKFKVSEMK